MVTYLPTRNNIQKKNNILYYQQNIQKNIVNLVYIYFY